MSVGSSNLSAFFVSNNGKIITSNTIQPSQAMNNSDIYAVISRISSNIAAMKMKANNPYVQKVINKPSTIINSFSFWQKVITQMLLTGNSYVLIQRDEHLNPVGLVHIPANEVTINILSKQAGDPVDDAIYTIRWMPKMVSNTNYQVQIFFILDALSLDQTHKPMASPELVHLFH